MAYRNVGVVILDHTGALVSRAHLKCKSVSDPEGVRWHMAQVNGLFEPHDVVTIEGLSFGSKGRSHLLAAAYAVWLEAAQRVGRIVFVAVPARTKIWAVGTKDVDKKPLIAWARKELGLSEADKLSEHEADALSLAQIARAADRLQQGEALLLGKKQRDMFENKQGTGILQGVDKSLFVGDQYGQRLAG